MNQDKFNQKSQDNKSKDHQMMHDKKNNIQQGKSTTRTNDDVRNLSEHGQQSSKVVDQKKQDWKKS